MSSLISIRSAIGDIDDLQSTTSDRTFRNLEVTETIVSDSILDKDGNPYIRSTASGGEVSLSSLRVTGGVTVNSLNVTGGLTMDSLVDSIGNPFVRVNINGNLVSPRIQVTSELSATKITSDNITDTLGNSYIRSSGTGGEVSLESLRVTGGLVVNSLQDNEGNQFVRLSDFDELVLSELTISETLQVDTVVSDRVQRTDGQPYLSLEPGITGTGRVDPSTAPFATEVFQNMAVEGNFVQFGGTMQGNAKYLTSFAERENQSLEQRLSEFGKFPERRIFVSATSGNDKNHGRSWDQAVKTIRRACELAEPRTTIFVASGDYYEITPINVRSNVAIIGDSLRTVFLYSKSWEFKEQDPDGKGERAVPVNGIDYNRRDFFHVGSGVYLYGLRFKHLESPGFCASFPAAMVDVGVDSNGRVGPILPNGSVGSVSDPVPILYSPDGYFVENLPETGPYPSAWDAEDPERTSDSFLQVYIERIHVESPGSGYTLNARIDINPPSNEGGVRAFAVPEILDQDGGIERVRVFQRGSGYVDEYRNPETGKNIIAISDGSASGAVLRPVFRVEAFRAWSEEAGIMRPAGNVFSPIRDAPYRSSRVYKSYNGRFDARDLYPGEDEPTLVLECGVNPRQGMFSEEALKNPGNFRAASTRMKEFRLTIQNAGIEMSGVPSDQELRDLCFRDIGFLVDAISSDLFEGGAYESIRAANAYFTRDPSGNINTVLTITPNFNQVDVTANVVRAIRDYVLGDTFSQWTIEPDALAVIGHLFSGIADTIDKGDEVGLSEPSEIVLNARRYVAYKLHDSNLTKWRFEGKNSEDEEWSILDERDFTFEQRDFSNRTVTPSFNLTIENPGEFNVAYEIIRRNRESIQHAVVESVRVSKSLTLTETQYDTCFRDVGLIVNAIMSDLRAGGSRFSKRAAVAYYQGNRSVLPLNQTQPTVDAINMIKDAILELLPEATFSSERTIVSDLIDGITSTITSPRISVEGRYGIQNSKAYQTYRLVMIQNEEDRVYDEGRMRVGRIELFEEDIPTVYVDGPEITGTIVESIEVASKGQGYTSIPSVTIQRNESVPTGTPEAEAVAVVENNQVVSIRVIKNGANYSSPPNVVISGGGGSGATALALMGDDYARVRVSSLDPESGRINSVVVVHPGSGYEVTPTVSIAPPLRLRPFVVASPYVQNCSNISGPWDNKRYRVSEFYPLPFPLDNVYRDTNINEARRINNYGSAGGIRIDGATCLSRSPLRSFVVDAFTQVNQGGIGFLLTNLAYAQFVSTFGTFCTTHMKAINGSFANASNSVTDFGLTGLEAYGYWTEPYTRARVVAPGQENSTTWSSAAGMFIKGEGYFSDIRTIEWTSRGANFTSDDVVKVQIGSPDVSGGIRARVVGEYDPVTGKTTLDLSTLTDGELEDLVVDRRSGEVTGYGQNEKLFGGSGYRFPPQVTVEVPEDRGEPQAIASLTGVSVIRVQVLEGRQPDILSIARIHGNWYTVESVSDAKTPEDQDIPGQYDVVFFPPVAFADLGFEIKFHSVSYLSTGSHVMEYVGSGITYNALPEYGGVPNEQVETRSVEPAKVFYTTSDHRGNSKVGPRFSVNQATGAIALDASSFNLQNIDGIGPFIRNGVAVGERLRELSNNIQLRSDATGQTDGQTAPTQIAVKTYVDRRAVPPPPEDYLTKRYFLQARQDAREVPGPGQFFQQYGWTELNADDLRIEEASLRVDVLTGMYVDGDTRIYGNANVGSLLISDPTHEVPLPNGSLSIRVDRTSNPPKLIFSLRRTSEDSNNYVLAMDMNTE